MCDNSNDFNYDEVNKICSLHRPISRLRCETVYYVFLNGDKGATHSVLCKLQTEGSREHYEH